MTTAPRKQPTQFGRYLLLDRVNIGGMAEVWRAKAFGAGGFERILAVKRILPNISEDEEFIRMFIDEARITVLLSHANIAQVHDMDCLLGNYYIAMEYVSGKDVRAVFDRCRKRGEPAPIPLACYVIAQCCEGLDYAHRAKDKQGRDMNIVHRDVSPQNALISYDGEVKVIDFGIAKAAGKANKTQAGILKGKFGYMSPEQIRGLPLDRRSDVFAIGICLYELLTGERLFVGESDFSVLEKVRKVEVLPPSHFNRKIPERLERLVMRSLAKDVDDRYQYALELAEDLRSFMYATGNTFSRKDLASFMRATFAEDYERERQRLQEYAEVRAPEGMMAALEQGYSVGTIPQGPGAAATASAVTAIPSLVPISGPLTGRSQTATAGALPPLTRPLPPGGRPVAPRLTALAPSAPAAPDQHAATQLVGGSGGAEGATSPGASDATRLLEARAPASAVAPAQSGPLPPVLVPAPVPAARAPTGQSGDWAVGDTVASRRPPPSQPAVSNPPAAVARTSARELELVPQSNSRLIIALVGIVALLGIGVVAAIRLSPPQTGVLVLDVPEEVRGTVTVRINGEVLTQADGAKLKAFPTARKVKVGRVPVEIEAPGYETVFEYVNVTSESPAELTTQMKKSK